jgi:hypothetical protein
MVLRITKEEAPVYSSRGFSFVIWIDGAATNQDTLMHPVKIRN